MCYIQYNPIAYFSFIREKRGHFLPKYFIIGHRR